MFGQKVMSQLTPFQLKQRQIANEYLQIQQSTQFLTQIVRYNPKSKRTLIKFYAMIDLKSIFSIIVQKSYLLYTCLLHKCNVLLSSELFIKPLKKNEIIPLQQAYCQYLLEKDLYRHSQLEQEQLLKKFRLIDIQKSPYSFGEYLCGFIIKIKNKFAPHFQRLKTSPQKFIFNQMEGLTNIVQAYLLPQIQKIPAKVIMLALEESQMFREYSVLVKCLNISLFTSLQMNPKSKVIFKQLMELEQFLLQESKQYQRANIKRIQETIQQSLKLLLKENIVFSQQSIGETKNSKIETKPNNKNQYSLGAVQEETTQMRKYTVKIFLKEKKLLKFTQETLENMIRKFNGEEVIPIQRQKDEKDKKDEKQKLNRSQYVIQYFSWKNLISIKYVTEIQLNVQNTDILMYHCNYLTYNWSNVTLQFVEKTEGKTKRKQRFLAFKAITYITSQQKILFKIMAMIDLLMIHAKISQTQLRKNIVNIDQYHLKTISLQNQCEHMKKIFINKIEKSYQILQSTFLKSYI